MKPADQAVRALKSWLETESGYGYVRQLIERDARGSLKDGHLAAFPGGRFIHDVGELRGDMAHEFIGYLLQTFLPQLSRRPDQVEMILNGRVRKVLEYALRRFFWRLKDLARRKDVNPRAYLYRRVREVLDHNKRFVIHKDVRDIPAYSPAAVSDELREDPAVFSLFDYLDWPVAQKPGKDENALFTANYLSTAALAFWQETARRLEGSYAVPVRELVRCLAVQHPWINRSRTESLSDHPDPPGNTESAEEQFDRIAALNSISVLAVQFAMGMDEQSRRIFLWSLDDPKVSFREIARRLDLPDHNRPYRIHRKTIAAMKKFTANWPGPPLDELPEDVGLAFIEAVRKICKKSLC